MWQSRTGASAMAVELAAALILATAVSDALGFLLGLGAFRIFEPGVDVDALASGRVESEGRVTEPGQ